MASFDGFIKHKSDADIETMLEDYFEKFEISPMDAVKHFSTLARRQLLKRFFAHIDLFKLTLEVPGDIAELGVFRGFDLMTWANLLEAYSIGNRTKTVYGFDNWEGFVSVDQEDGGENTKMQRQIGGYSPGRFKEELLAAIEIFDADRFIPQKPRIKLIEGDISETVPAFLDEFPGVRFSFIHFDCDMYAPTKAALRPLWERLSRGGLILFDEYAIKEWPGETKAVDELLEDLPGAQLKTLTWTNAPAAYLVKA
ncbi:macrocin O-methyltransferase [Luminiphilus sp.]|nr:macrocin O-methyltransferase [Luminiphilus sp.]